MICSINQFSLTLFKNVRSLSLKWFNENQFIQIRSDILPKLVYLSSSINKTISN